MKKVIKTCLIILVAIILCFVLDFICIFTINRPLFAIKGDLPYQYKGLFYNTFNCPEYPSTQIKSKTSKFVCSSEKVQDNENDSVTKTPTEKDIQRYEEIKRAFSIAMDDHIKSTFVYRDSRNCNGFINGNTTSDTLIKNRYLSKDAMLDTDNKSYCKAIAKKYIVFLKKQKDVCDMKYEIYISCKNYKTPGYDDLEYRSFSNYKHESISYE